MQYLISFFFHPLIWRLHRVNLLIRPLLGFARDSVLSTLGRLQMILCICTLDRCSVLYLECLTVNSLWPRSHEFETQVIWGWQSGPDLSSNSVKSQTLTDRGRGRRKSEGNFIIAVC